MKKFLSMFLTFMLVISMTACGSDESSNSATDQTPAAANSADADDNTEANDDGAIDSDAVSDNSGRVLFEYEGLTATLASAEATEDGGIAVTIQYDNTDDIFYEIYGENIAVNGIDTLEWYSYLGDVYTKDSDTYEFTVDVAAMERMNIEQIETYALNFYVVEKYEEDVILYNSDRVLIYGDKEPVAEVPEGLELYNANGLRICILSLYTTYYNKAPGISFSIENNTDKEVEVFGSPEPVINDNPLLYSGFSVRIAPHTFGIDEYNITSSQYKNIGVTTHEDVVSFVSSLKIYMDGEVLSVVEYSIGYENGTLVLK